MTCLSKKIFICTALQLHILWTVAGTVTGIQQDSVPVTRSDSSDHRSDIVVDSFYLDIFLPSSGVQFYKDGIVFLSMSKNEDKMVPEHISFGTFDAYYAIPGDSTVGRHMIFSPSSAFPHPSEAFTFTGDYMTMYFAKPLKKGNREKIFKAVYISGEKNLQGWKTENNPLPFCTGNYSYTHPALSKDGKSMIFASDNSNSIGGMDLFVTFFQDNQWTEPKNLGPEINSVGNEFFPYLDTANNLYYSSDGIPGYGGYDLFVSKYNGKSWDDPINLSRNINTENDDIAIKINRIDGKSAFYTVRQPLQNNEMQLFRITLDSLLAVSDSVILSNILYSMAISENIFPSRKIMAFVDTSRIVPVKIRDTFELDQKDIDVAPEDETVMHLDTIKTIAAEVPVQEVLAAKKDIITEPSQPPQTATPPVIEIPAKQPPLAENIIVTPPPVQLIPIEPVVETPVKETPVVEKVITAPPQVETTPVEPVVETPVKETPVAEKEIVTTPPVETITTKPVIETPVKEIPVAGKVITAPPQVETTPVEPVETPVKETPVAEKEITPGQQLQTVPVEHETVEINKNLMYKVQVKSAIRSIGNFVVNVNSREYTTSEYFYKNEYRYTIGEFSSLGPAVQLQNACRQIGYPQAFVAAFENNVRTLDKSKFRRSGEEIITSVTTSATGPQVEMTQTTPLTEITKEQIPETTENLDIIVYKVQFLSSTKSKGNVTVKVGGKKYQASEYLYKGEYRYTIGEFSDIIPAIELQYACRRAGYPKAFVVIFKNNMRTLDPELFIRE